MRPGTNPHDASSPWAFRALRLAGCTVLTCAASACTSSDPPRSQPERTVVRVGIPVKTIDPNGAIGLRSYVTLFTQEGLVASRLDGRLEPRLAEHWERLKDGSGLRVRLRPDLKFHDGSPVTADAVKQSLERSLRNPAQLIQYPMLRDISRLDVEDARTLVIAVGRYSALLIEDLTVQIVRRGPDGRTFGTGAFSSQTESSEEILLQANPFFYEGRPSIDAVALKPYPNVRTAWAAMMRDEVDVLYDIPADAREFIEKESSVRVVSSLRPYVYSLIFNNRRPMFAPAGVRRALSMAVDREAIVETVLRGHGRAAGANAWPQHWAYPGGTPAFTYEPARAFQALETAGFGVQRAAAQRTRPHFTCLVPAGVSPHEQISVLLQKQFYDVGVDMAIEAVPIPEMMSRLAAGNFDTVLLDLNGGPSLVRLYTFWHSSGAAFYGNFGYSGADAALDGLRAAQDEAALRAAVVHVQEVLHDDPPAIFICWPEAARALSRRFEVPEPGQRDVLLTIRQWRTRITTPSQ